MFPFAIAGVSPDAKAPRREQFGRWATAKDNPYFAKSYVNRVWSYLTGVGIIDPVDDIRAGNPPTNPELLERLTKQFTDDGFDTRKLMATICKSRTYQLSIKALPLNKDDEANYSHAQPRRLPAEVLFDSIHVVTGSQSRLPGLPAGARAAQLLDSNVELPGGFLELFGKPVRESACECERSNTMMLGPVLAMVNGPIVGDAVRDPNNHIAKFTAGEPNDAKVVEEIYLSVLCRKPTAAEVQLGLKALEAGKADHKLLADEHARKKKLFDDYAKGLDAKLPAFEQGLRAQKPTAWAAAKPTKAESRTGANVEVAQKATVGSTLKIADDASVVASGKIEPVDIYTLTLDVKQDAPLTAIRLEVLPDDSLPAKGPGRAENGNFVLNEFTVQAKLPADDKAKAVKLVQPQATFSQDNYLIAHAIDGNPTTGWAVAPQFGKPHTAVVLFDKPINAKDGVTLTVTMDHRFGTGHIVGKFRLSVTADKAPKVAGGLPADVVAVLDTPADKRTPQQTDKLKGMLAAQDGEYARLQKDIPVAPPSDPRAVGAQDLTWALLNTPAFLFNR